MNKKTKILMLASENDALAEGKVGGIGDVVRDVPIALLDQNCTVDVLTPAYGMFSALPGAIKVSEFEFRFAGQTESAQLYSVPPKDEITGVRHWALELPQRFYGRSGGIYFNDSAAAPFATDASKFACFCMAAATAIVTGELSAPNVIHLHDWHSAMLLLLRESAPEFAALREIPCVYTVHNLALQGIRPLRGHESALESWFPELDYPTDLITDPRAQDCVNPMRIGINLADKVHVVSPTYAEEVLLPSDKDKGFIGGEGLEKDLIRANSEGKLFGILNGCAYPVAKYRKFSRKRLTQLLNNEVLRLISKRSEVDSALFIAHERVKCWASKRQTGLLLTSVGRVTDQKIAILKQALPLGKSALEAILMELGEDGVFILLGSGDDELQQFLTEIAGKHENFIFIKGYCESLSDALYQSGDLFIMPSSFEPCGISQMLSMRAGQPCLVHAVGGLRDTVINDVNGFSFKGDSVPQQAKNLVKRFAEIKRLKQDNNDIYRGISGSARKVRFLWKHSAKQYISKLYQP